MNGNSYGSSVGLWLSPGSGVVSETSAVEFDLCCVALARSASCHSNRSAPPWHQSLSSSASSKMSSSAHLRTLWRRSTARQEGARWYFPFVRDW
jgi:hypothetical protein